jgi:peptide/nickel transport system substrate-binding protein
MKAFSTMVLAGAVCVGISPVFAEARKDTLAIAQSVDVQSRKPHSLNASGSINVANHL